VFVYSDTAIRGLNLRRDIGIYQSLRINSEQKEAETETCEHQCRISEHPISKVTKQHV
jgi:hypothetical protein